MSLKTKDLKNIETEFYTNTAGEYNDNTEQTKNMDMYPVIPKSLKTYKNKIWQEYPDCYLYFVKFEGELGLFVVIEFESYDYELLLQKSAELSQNTELKPFRIYHGRSTGLKSPQSAARHELGLFLPINTPTDDISKVIWYLRKLQNRNTENCDSFVERYQKTI